MNNVFNAKHDRVIFRKIELEFKSKGGIVLGEIEKEREVNYGRVVAVGPGKQLDGTGLIPTTTQVGDIIAFNDRIALRFNYKGENYYTLRENEVIFTLNDEEALEKPYQLEGYEYDKTISRVLV